MEFHYFWEPGRCPPPKMSTEVMKFQRSEIESGARISKVPIKVMKFHYFWECSRCPPPKTSIKVTEFQRSEIESDGPPL